MANQDPRRITRTMPATQLVALLLAFVLAAVAGGVLTAGLVIPAVAGANAAADSTVEVYDELPAELEPSPLSQQSRIYAADGKQLATFYAQNRIVVPLDKVSEPMQNAVIAIEDERFWEHGGIDMRGMSRALANNVAGHATQGASTLTQQYVKNMLIEQALQDDDPFGVIQAKEDSISRKLREAKMAIALEQKMGKEEILQGYLNVAQFGSKSIYGVETAARYYFGKHAADLSVVEAATIAGITKSPSRFDPTVNPQEAKVRRNLVLQNMWKLGHISTEERDEAQALTIKETLNVKPVEIGCHAADGAAFFCDYVIKDIVNNPAFGETRSDRQALLYRGGLEITTTLDPKKQKAAEQSVREAVPAEDSSGLEAAIASVEPGTGKIVAMAQNVPYTPPQGSDDKTTLLNYNADPTHGASKGFQVGSNFKPIVLAEWLREGHTLNETVSAAKVARWPQNFNTPCVGTLGAAEPWAPANSEGVAYSNLSALEATYRSVNTAYAAMGYQLNLCDMRDTAWKMGFRPTNSGVQKKTIYDPKKTDIDIQAPMIVGTQESTPLFMAAMYATLASGGTYCEPVAITKVTGPGGKDYELPGGNCDENALPENVANTVVSAMENVLKIGTASGHGLDGGRPAAGKTGTTQLSWHTWFTGFTKQLSTSVWVGDVEGNIPHMGITVNGQYHEPLYGSDVAAPAWNNYMNAASAGMPMESFGAPDPALVGAAPPPPPPPSTGGDDGGDDGDEGGGNEGGGNEGGGNEGGGNGGDKGKGNGRSDASAAWDAITSGDWGALGGSGDDR
ncbi:transglycosylase domain-containing protein [Isoptericola cucumis]|nr:transglycosylase domain-containing protein [Isoptericola cucumis]